MRLGVLLQYGGQRGMCRDPMCGVRCHCGVLSDARLAPDRVRDVPRRGIQLTWLGADHNADPPAELQGSSARNIASGGHQRRGGGLACMVWVGCLGIGLANPAVEPPAQRSSMVVQFLAASNRLFPLSHAGIVWL